MATPDHLDYSRDVVLRISPQKKTFTVEEHKPGGIIAQKEILPTDLYYAINAGNETFSYLDSGVLPEHCIGVSMCSANTIYYLWYPERRAYICYGDKEYMDFPIPRLVFGVSLLYTGRVGDCTLGVIADETPTPDTPMFHYPFSNVFDGFRVCTGNNVLPRYRNRAKLVNFPSYLLGIPDNDDYYDRSCNRKGLGHAELLEYLKDKEPAHYYSDILVPNGKTLGDFMNRG